MTMPRCAALGIVVILLLSTLCAHPVFAHRPVVVKNRSSKAVSFEVYGEGGEDAPMFTAEGTKSVWRRFYEKYGRDHYYMGPEYDAMAGEGIYYVRVFNGSNRGRYSLAIGKREKFTFFSLIGAIVKARSLDPWFFK
jgi:hypothetical protein